MDYFENLFYVALLPNVRLSETDFNDGHNDFETALNEARFYPDENGIAKIAILNNRFKKGNLKVTDLITIIEIKVSHLDGFSI